MQDMLLLAISNSAEAVDKVRQVNPDLILLDVMMPNIERLYSLHVNPRRPVNSLHPDHFFNSNGNQ